MQITFYETILTTTARALFWFLVLLLVVLKLIPLLENFQPPLISYIVQSGSMEPTLLVGDLILVKPAEKYVLEDIITFKNGENVITHRVIQEEEGRLETKGDNNRTADPDLIEKEAILGKLWLRVPLAGYAIVFMQEVFGFIFVLSVLLILYILSEPENQAKKPTE